jgi:iron complex transport system permease protein
MNSTAYSHWIGLAAGLVAAILIGAMAGHSFATPVDLYAALSGDGSLASRLIMDWRIPRVLAAACVGALLGVGGCLFQGVFRNPLAEPYLLGSAGGAALGATIALLAPQAWLPATIALPLLAFLGAWGATVLVLSMARVAGVVDAAGLLLAGVAVAAVLGALRSFMMLALSDDNVNLQVVLSWTLGGIQTPRGQGLLILAGLTLALVALSMRLARGLDLIGLGETMAESFGLDVRRFLWLAVLWASIVVAVAVAHGGLVAFVGLIAPHLARWLFGPDHARLIPASAFIGAIIVTCGDALARSVLPPADVPLGLVTAVAGGPFFLAMLMLRLRSWR